MVNLGKPVDTEVIETLGLKIQHNLHCLEEVPLSKISIPGFGEWILVLVDGAVWSFLIGGIPEEMREQYCFNSAPLPNHKISIQKIIEGFVEFLLNSFAECQGSLN